MKLGLPPPTPRQRVGGGSVRGPGRKHRGISCEGLGPATVRRQFGAVAQTPSTPLFPRHSASHELSLIPLLCPALLALV